jgi:two-component system sensor histidine kinase/response regulator
MVVDDTTLNLEVLATILHENGYQVTQFSRGDMALRAATQYPPDLILLDIIMPEMDGFEVCRRLKADEALREIPVIFISALDDIANLTRAFNEGGVDYVSKPFHKEEVLVRIKTHLSLRRQQLQIEAQNQQIKHNYELLLELEKQRDGLVHMIVHDMRNSLMGILGNAELLEMRLRSSGDDQHAWTINELLKSGRGLNDMISTMLDINRMESGKMPLEKGPCDLRNVISEAWASLSAGAENITMVYEPHSDVSTAFCDHKITRRIIENLLVNAIKFTGKNGQIYLGVLDEEGMVKVIVRDTGPGIPPEHHQLIFEKFGQVALKQEKKQYSTGLGLTFCKLAVEAQGGRIGVSSEVGTGSTFWFTVPSMS